MVRQIETAMPEIVQVLTSHSTEQSHFLALLTIITHFRYLYAPFRPQHTSSNRLPAPGTASANQHQHTRTPQEPQARSKFPA